ncbi:MAG: hypothetical protein ABW221_19510 [Vicinamibacteria bacterium]
MKVLSTAALLLLSAAPLFAQGSAPAATPAASPAPALSNTIKWSTASEVENFGYDVFRGDKEEGPFTRLNAKTIAGAGTVDEPRAYQYVDATIEAGRAYWYYVESISLAGVREKFTPVFQSKAKNADGSPVAAAAKP